MEKIIPFTSSHTSTYKRYAVIIVSYLIVIATNYTLLTELVYRIFVNTLSLATGSGLVSQGMGLLGIILLYVLGMLAVGTVVLLGNLVFISIVSVIVFRNQAVYHGIRLYILTVLISLALSGIVIYDVLNPIEPHTSNSITLLTEDYNHIAKLDRSSIPDSLDIYENDVGIYHGIIKVINNKPYTIGSPFLSVQKKDSTPSYLVPCQISNENPVRLEPAEQVDLEFYCKVRTANNRLDFSDEEVQRMPLYQRILARILTFSIVYVGKNSEISIVNGKPIEFVLEFDTIPATEKDRTEMRPFVQYSFSSKPYQWYIQ